MTATEAREKISKEFIDSYYEFLEDLNTLDVQAFGRKYGIGYSDKTPKTDCVRAVMNFQKYVFAGRYINAWEKVGYDKQIIWELHRDGFLSHDYNTSWEARQLGRQDFYYLSQKTAKEVYKKYKH